MATLSGQKIKDAFASLLKLSTNTATTTLKNVESGDGVATALQLATGKVGVNGTLEFPTVPTTGTTETSALLLNGSNQVVKRTLNAAAFTGATVTGATAPLVVSGGNVTINNPSTISDVGTPAGGDRFLVYDTSATTWKRIDYSALAAFINPNVYQSAPELVCRVLPPIALTTTPQYVDFANIGSAGTDTVEVGAAATIYTLGNVYGGTNTSVEVLEDGIYQVSLMADITTTTVNTDVTFYLDINGVVYAHVESSFKSAGSNFMTESSIININGGEIVSLRAKASSSTDLEAYSVFHLRKL